MEVILGSNRIVDTSGILNVSGADQIWIEIDPDTDAILLTMDIYNSIGKKVAKLRRNAWAFNKSNLYGIMTNPQSLTLYNKKTRSVIVEVKILTKDKIEIQQGHFYTAKRQLIKITPESLNIGGTILSENTIIGCGKAFAIG